MKVSRKQLRKIIINELNLNPFSKANPKKMFIGEDMDDLAKNLKEALISKVTGGRATSDFDLYNFYVKLDDNTHVAVVKNSSFDKGYRGKFKKNYRPFTEYEEALMQKLTGF